jgi:hypothetical protein
VVVPSVELGWLHRTGTVPLVLSSGSGWDEARLPTRFSHQMQASTVAIELYYTIILPSSHTIILSYYHTAILPY